MKSADARPFDLDLKSAPDRSRTGPLVVDGPSPILETLSPPAPGAGQARVGPIPPSPRKPNVRRGSNSTSMRSYRGIAVSPGVAIGPPLIIDARGVCLPPRAIAADAVLAELVRLDAALAAAQIDAESAEADARGRVGPQYADILGAHARMIADPALRREARTRVEREKIAAEHALIDVLDGYAARLEGLVDSHLAARSADVRDIQQRILEQLRPQGESDPSATPQHQIPATSTAGEGLPSVALAHDLSPSQTAGFDPKRVLGFATEAGGRASHTAIVAAALEIPAVVGLGRFLDEARRCRAVIIDGDEGLVVLDPDPATLKRYRRASAERAARFAGLAGLSRLPAETKDGVHVELLGNIEFPAEVAACRERGASGVGLYRTEFLYLNVAEPPGEEEQVAAYQAVARALPGKPIIIRTLDLGADRLAVFQNQDAAYSFVEPNPFLGLRSLRLSLRDPRLFRTQLRAILRVSALGDIRVMFPLVSTLGEFRKARALLDEVAAELDAEGVPFRRDLPVGAMIEVPAAALMADRLADEVDFFSIGTNDLIQYTLAVDRTNENVADLYNAADPAVLRLIEMVVRAAERGSIEVNVCGSMGGEPLHVMLLLGLGVRRLSMSPHQLPEIKRVIRGVSMSDARAVAAEALRQDTAEAVLGVLREAFGRCFDDQPAAVDRRAKSTK